MEKNRNEYRLIVYTNERTDVDGKKIEGVLNSLLCGDGRAYATLDNNDWESTLAKHLSNDINACPNLLENAKKMAQDHPYLQQEMFKLFIHYMDELAKKKYYDARNEWAVMTARKLKEVYDNL